MKKGVELPKKTPLCVLWDEKLHSSSNYLPIECFALLQNSLLHFSALFSISLCVGEVFLTLGRSPEANQVLT